MHTDTVRKRIKLYGIVQGIGFRPFVKRLADELHINGSVCNHGSFVDIVAEADRNSIDEFERRLTSDAPPASHIVRVRADSEEPMGEVDFLIDDFDSLSAVPIEVKSGKDYKIHSALSAFVNNADYHVKKAYVLSNERQITVNDKITYLPIYYAMFF